jgi:hypothetical protein
MALFAQPGTDRKRNLEDVAILLCWFCQKQEVVCVVCDYAEQATKIMRGLVSVAFWQTNPREWPRTTYAETCHTIEAPIQSFWSVFRTEAGGH